MSRRNKMKLAALLVFLASASTSGAIDIATQLTVARIDYDLPALEKPVELDSFVFRIFIRPALSDSSYAFDGKLRNSESGGAAGSLTLIERAPSKMKSYTFVLTDSQAREVHGWFSDAKFLDPKTAEASSATVLDGDEILIEGFVGGRYFRIYRNSGDSAASAAFFRRAQAFRILKDAPNQSPQPSRPTGG